MGVISRPFSAKVVVLCLKDKCVITPVSRTGFLPRPAIVEIHREFHCGGEGEDIEFSTKTENGLKTLSTKNPGQKTGVGRFAATKARDTGGD